MLTRRPTVHPRSALSAAARRRRRKDGAGAGGLGAGAAAGSGVDYRRSDGRHCMINLLGSSVLCLADAPSELVQAVRATLARCNLAAGGGKAGRQGHKKQGGGGQARRLHGKLENWLTVMTRSNSAPALTSSATREGEEEEEEARGYRGGLGWLVHWRLPGRPWEARSPEESTMACVIVCELLRCVFVFLYVCVGV